MNRPGRKSAAALAGALVVGAGAGAGGYALVDGSGSSPAAVTAAVTRAQPTAATSSTLTINQIYRQAGPGVVDIVVNSTSSNGTSPFPFGRQQQSQAEGSGFVYDTKGDIVTNDHVVDGATSIKVKFANGKTYAATVVGTDPSTDLAVIRVTSAPASLLKPIALADSSSVQVGDGVVAIGSPFGLTQTVTAGIVSALGRAIDAPNNYQIAGAIQTDAPINHGNSGGPLLNLQGQVVGVNAQIESDSGDNAGVGFAIASNTVKNVVPQLISGGSVQHAFLGVTIGNATGGGVQVSQVQPGSPADDAGLKSGDVITAVDGQSVETTTDLGSAIDAHRPGDKVSVTFTRSGASKTVTVTLGTRPSS